MWPWLFESPLNGNATDTQTARRGEGLDSERWAALCAMKPCGLASVGRAGDLLAVHVEHAFLAHGGSLFDAVPECERGQARACWERGVACGGAFSMEVCAEYPGAQPARLCTLRAAQVASGAREGREWLVTVEERDDPRRVARRVDALLSLVREGARDQALEDLTGGLAHQFNNLLHAVVGHADLLARCLEKESPMQQSLACILRSAERAADLCKQMLACAGRGGLLREPCVLSTLVSSMREELHASLGGKHKLELELAPTLPRVDADPVQLRLVLRNLIANAVEALDAAGGTIRVRTSLRYLDATELPKFELGATLSPGHYVSLEVRDDGHGIPDDMLPRVYDPFFTSKFFGRGLGLSAVRGVARSLGGAVRTCREELRGTCVEVVVPVERQLVRTGADAAPRAAVLLVCPEGGEAALLRLALEPLGPRVRVVSSLARAFQGSSWREHLDLVIVDDAVEQREASALERVLRGELRLPTVVLRAPGPAIQVPCPPERAACRVVSKPWTVGQVTSIVREVLGQAHAQRGGAAFAASGVLGAIGTAAANFYL